MTDFHTWYAERFAELLDLLDAIPEGGGTMLDHTLVVWTNELSTGSHDHHDLPIVVAGATETLHSGRLIRWAPVSPVQGPWGVTTVGQPHNKLLTTLAGRQPGRPRRSAAVRRLGAGLHRNFAGFVEVNTRAAPAASRQ